MSSLAFLEVALYPFSPGFINPKRERGDGRLHVFPRWRFGLVSITRHQRLVLGGESVPGVDFRPSEADCRMSGAIFTRRQIPPNRMGIGVGGAIRSGCRSWLARMLADRKLFDSKNLTPRPQLFTIETGDLRPATPLECALHLGIHPEELAFPDIVYGPVPPVAIQYEDSLI